MTLLITIIAAVITTLIWYSSENARAMKVGILCYMFWGASLMWFVDAVVEYMELGAEYFAPEAADMLIAGDNTRSLEDSRELVYASQEWISAQYIADAADWGVFDPERWDAFYGWLYENNLTKHDLRGTGYSNDYLPKD